jgi:hypothetical protein
VAELATPAHVVMLGKPVARESQFFNMLRSLKRNVQRLRRAAALAHGHEIEHREF